MPADDRDLRRAALVCLGVAVGAPIVLWLLFGAVLDAPDAGCDTNLQPGAYRDALVPAHAAAAVAVAAAVVDVHARRRGRVARWAQAALAAVAAVALVSLAWPPPFALLALVAVLAVVPVGGTLLLALVIRTALVLRRDGAAAWDAHAATAEALAWAVLVLGIPAAFGFAYAGAVDLFCF